MSEYDLVCDVCAMTVEPRDAVITWVTDSRGEHDFTLAHQGCAPPGTTERRPVKQVTASENKASARCLVGNFERQRRSLNQALRPIREAILAPSGA